MKIDILREGITIPREPPGMPRQKCRIGPRFLLGLSPVYELNLAKEYSRLRPFPWSLLAWERPNVPLRNYYDGLFGRAARTFATSQCCSRFRFGAVPVPLESTWPALHDELLSSAIGQELAKLWHVTYGCPIICDSGQTSATAIQCVKHIVREKSYCKIIEKYIIIFFEIFRYISRDFL